MDYSQTHKNHASVFLKMLRRFWPDIRKHYILLVGSFVAFFVEALFYLLEPWPLKFVFDRIIPSVSGHGHRGTHSVDTLNTAIHHATRSHGHTGIQFIDALNPMTLLIFSAIAVVVFSSMRAFTAYCSTIGFALLGNRVLTKIRNTLYGHIQCLPLSFHNKSHSGDLTVRVISDVNLLQDVIVTSMLPLLGSLLVLIGMIGVMLWLNWQLSLKAFAIVPLFLFFTTRLIRKIREASGKQRHRESTMAATAAETISAIKTVQALSLESTFNKTFSSENSKSLSAGVKAKRLEAGLERTVDILIAVATGLVLWYGTHLVIRNRLTPGDLIVFFAYLKNAFKPLRNFAKYTGRIARASASGERILHLLELTPEIRDLPDAIKAPAFKGLVRFENVNFSYNSKRLALKDIDFEAKPGQHIAIVGSSGAGKTTMVGLLLRFYDPALGQVMIDGHDIRSYTLDSLRSQISIVLQDTLLFAASVRDNIAYGVNDPTQEQIEAAARLANAHSFIVSLTDGYDTILGERGATLSIGQRQRIAIARAAIRKSPILILDEPTTGLDKENEYEVAIALKKLAVGRTTFLISHNLHQARTYDRILYLEDGRLIEYGSHTDLMRANGHYAALYRFQEEILGQNVQMGESHAYYL